MDSYFVASEIRRAVPAIKIPNSNLSTGRRINILRQSEKVFETYRMIFEELKGQRGAAFIRVFCFLDRAFSVMKTKNKPTKCTN